MRARVSRVARDERVRRTRDEGKEKVGKVFTRVTKNRA